VRPLMKHFFTSLVGQHPSIIQRRQTPNISHNITSVGDRQTYFGYRNTRELDRRKAETSRIPLFLCASAQKQGDSSEPRWVRVFAHQKRENPILFGGFLRTLSRTKGSLKLLSFGIFPLQKQRKVHPKRID
ncbi:MAG: hypothetical protein J6W14_00535, partial [Clostridia bacterium]|nr:hypothetical protein [Clostridia bacterium]